MKSVFKLSSGHMALLAAIGLAAGYTPAAAADLGGDCCADLEERVAELEATTARKGNRKVSLTISGWVNKGVFWWDDGSESNVYVGDNTLEQSRVRFVGEAKIIDGWSAGYVLELGIQDTTSNSWDQFQDHGTLSGNGTTTPIQIRKSNWYIKSKDFGQVAVGLNGTATYHLIDDADATNTRNFSDYQAAAVAQGAFFLRSGPNFILTTATATPPAPAALKWSDILKPTVDNASPGQNGRRNVVRYDSPDLMGFVVTASWGEDDMGGVAVTYKGTWGDFKVVAKGGWEQTTDETTNPCSSITSTGGISRCEWFGGGATVMHVPTGLYVYGGAGENIDHALLAAHPTADNTDLSWYIQGGIEQKWLPVGKTTIFGEYRHDDAGSNFGVTFAAATPVLTPGAHVQTSTADFWAAGVVQNVAPAAMDLYLIYRHADATVTDTAGASANIDGFSTVIGGALIQF